MGVAVEDFTGRTLDWLLVLEKRKGVKRTMFLCQCICGESVERNAFSLKTAGFKSCGCYNRNRMAVMRLSHGKSKSPEYSTWAQMRRRCLNPTHHKYYRYGGRGITICPEWESFEAFFRDMGPKPTTGHSIDRIDNDGPYAPWNCKWATVRDQSRNTSLVVKMTVDGETLCIADMAKKHGLDALVVSKRRRRGWTDDEAVKTPLKRGKPYSLHHHRHQKQQT